MTRQNCLSQVGCQGSRVTSVALAAIADDSSEPSQSGWLLRVKSHFNVALAAIADDASEPSQSGWLSRVKGHFNVALAAIADDASEPSQSGWLSRVTSVALAAIADDTSEPSQSGLLARVKGHFSVVPLVCRFWTGYDCNRNSNAAGLRLQS